GGIVGIAAPIGPWTDDPDRTHLVERNAERARDAVLHEMRLLRAGPAGDVAILRDLDQCAGRSHAGVRLERPLVFRLDHARGGPECLVDVAGLLGVDFTLADRRLADVIVERVLIDERGFGVGPFDLQLLRCLDRTPFGLGDDAEETLVPNYS